jgi:hypothetical protein
MIRSTRDGDGAGRVSGLGRLADPCDAAI